MYKYFKEINMNVFIFGIDGDKECHIKAKEL